LHRVCWTFHCISQYESIRAHWLLTKYGPEEVLSECWRWRFVRGFRGQVCRCDQRKRKSTSHKTPSSPNSTACPVEEMQINLLQTLLSQGANPHSTNQMPLKMASRFNHLKLVKELLDCGADANATVLYSKSWRKPRLGGEFQQTVRNDDPDNKTMGQTMAAKVTLSVNLLLQACQCDNYELVRLLLSANPKPSQQTLSQSLSYTLCKKKMEIAKLLIENGAQSTISVTLRLLQRASAYRLGLGLRNRFTSQLEYSISALPQSDFERSGGTIVRSCAEIGSVGALKACIDRGGDANVWDGLALYSAVYSGNQELVEYLVGLSWVNLHYFDWKRRVFCWVLLYIEAIAVGMFGVLIAIWIYGFLGLAIPLVQVDTDSTERDPVTVIELTAMAIPAFLALMVMYRLVPAHRLVRCLRLVQAEKAKRAVRLNSVVIT